MPIIKQRTVRDIPDIILRDAYVSTSQSVDEYRENFLAEDSNVEKVKQLLGPPWAHIRLADLRKHISNCCKNPEAHGGGWNAAGKHGPSKGHKLKVESNGDSKYMAKLMARKDWPALRKACYTRDGYRCRICNDDRTLIAHHRTYRTFEKPEELDDLTTLCRECHAKFHGKEE